MTHDKLIADAARAIKDNIDCNETDAVWIATAALAPALAIMGDCAFLIDRIDELDWSLDPDDFAREWSGHVDPALCRARAALGPHE